jgi:uncharacterized protein involved in cysteine biosynthesis
MTKCTIFDAQAIYLLREFKRLHLLNMSGLQLDTRVRSFFYGICLPYAALKIILSSRRLVVLSALPIVFTLAFYVFVISKLQIAAHGFVTGLLLKWGLNPTGFTSLAISICTSLVLLLLGVLTFSLVASIASSPFNDFLAESAERLTDPPLKKIRKRGIGHTLKLILIDLAKTTAATVMSLVALIFSWVPILNLFAFGAAFLLLGFQYLSYPQTRRGQGVRQGFRFIGRHFFACLGFGAIFSVLFAIPIIAAFCVPLAVVGGTLLFAKGSAGEVL